MIVTFTGDPPYALPTAHNATARSVGETVELTVYVFADDKRLIPVEIPMNVATARTLAGQIAAAANQAELASRKG